MDDRLRAMCDLLAADVREGAGLHEYDGRIQDLSPDGVRASLARLGGAPLDDPHDENHLRAFEDYARLAFGELELHRRNPAVHLANFDLACYDRDYAPATERAAAKQTHLRQWPEAVQFTIDALDEVPAPVAAALVGAFRGLAAGIDESDAIGAAALAAHAQLVAHIEGAARDGSPDASLGATALASLMGVIEAMPVDLAELALSLIHISEPTRQA